MRTIKVPNDNGGWRTEEKETIRESKPNWERIAWWQNQPRYDRGEKFVLCNVAERAVRLRKMHEFFGTAPLNSGHGIESRELLFQLMECAN